MVAGLAFSILTGAVSGGVFYEPSPNAALAPARPCTPVLIVGLRGGNGDAVDSDQGLGPNAWALADAVRSRLGVGSQVLGSPYDTGPWWQLGGQIRSASRGLSVYLSDRHRRCPAERLVLIGYSEGAAVIHLTLQHMRTRIAAVVLAADILRVAGTSYDAIVSPRQGLLVPLLLGWWTPARDVIPAAMESRVRSYCLPYDPICSFGVTSVSQQLIADAHGTYWRDPLRILDSAADFVACRLREVGVPVDCARTADSRPLDWVRSLIQRSAWLAVQGT
jgi:hypothetical protein